MWPPQSPGVDVDRLLAARRADAAEHRPQRKLDAALFAASG
jgi:hypothetical protein